MQREETDTRKQEAPELKVVNWCDLTSNVFVEKNKSSEQDEQNIRDAFIAGGKSVSGRYMSIK
jgi:hypothetical protein